MMHVRCDIRRAGGCSPGGCAPGGVCEAGAGFRAGPTEGHGPRRRPLGPRPASGSVAAVLACAAALVLGAGSCAQKGFPPGGPRDTTPPHVLWTSPDSGAVSVPLASEIQITFDDKMDKRSVEGALHITPPTDLESVKWRDRTLLVAPAGALRRNTTYTVLIASRMRDRRNNKAEGPTVVHFSTGEYVAPGVVKGKVETGRARPQGVLVWSFPESECPPDLESSAPAGVAEADAGGEFAVGGLDTTAKYCVYAHLDADYDDELDEGELFIGADSLVAFPRDSMVVRGVTIYLVPDDEPGKIVGTVADSSGGVVPGSELLDRWPGVRGRSAPQRGAPAESLAAPAPVDTLALRRAWADSVYRAAKIVIIAVSETDSTNFAQAVALRDGSFRFKSLKPGAYALTAFRDLDGDKAPDPPEEPTASADGVVVRPGRETDAGLLVLRRERQRGGSE